MCMIVCAPARALSAEHAVTWLIMVDARSLPPRRHTMQTMGSHAMLLTSASRGQLPAGR